jgi:hypothetical protein
VRGNKAPAPHLKKLPLPVSAQNAPPTRDREQAVGRNPPLDLSIIATNLSTRKILDCDVTWNKEVKKEGPMAILFIKCPHTSRPISTGIETDPESFASLPEPSRV